MLRRQLAHQVEVGLRPAEVRVGPAALLESPEPAEVLVRAGERPEVPAPEGRVCRAQTILVLPEQVAKMRAECPRPEALRGQESEAGREPLLAAAARAAESPTLEALHELEAAPEPLLAPAARAAESPTLEALHELEAAPEPAVAMLAERG
jgi:hypothetical protein